MYEVCSKLLYCKYCDCAQTFFSVVGVSSVHCAFVTQSELRNILFNFSINEGQQRMTSPDSPGKSILHTHGVLVPSGITVPLNY